MRLTWTLAVLFLCVTFSTVAQLRPEDEDGRIRERFESFRKRRLAPGITLPEDIRVQAISAMRRMEQSKLVQNVQGVNPVWKSIGPHSTGGRVKSIIVHPTKHNTLYIGAAAGGVWKTTDGGASWAPLTDDANATAMGSLWLHPGNPDIIYAGTGEQVTNANTFLGAGLMKSTDAGKTWATIGLTHVGSISRIYVHPKNTQLMMAGCMNTAQGVYKSTDGGSSWVRMLNETVYDMTINPTDENEWFVGVAGKGILYTSDGGSTWEQRINGLNGEIGRTSIQQSATNPNVLYVLMELNSLAVIAKSVNKGMSWTVQYQDGQGCFFAGSCNPSGSQGFYDNYISISPTNPDIVYAGGIDIWRTTDGKTWSNVTQGYLADNNGQNVPHVDQHCLAFSPDGAIYAGNDGGMIKTLDMGNTWFGINNGLEITQFYDFDNDPSRKERSFGGTQDNGTLGTFGNIEWDTVWGGDGMVTIVNQDDPDMVYGNNPNGAPFRMNFRTNARTSIRNGLDLNETALWAAPMVINPMDGATLMHGRRRVWRTDNFGDFWTPTSPFFANSISSLAFSPADPSVIWAGSTTGDLMVSSDYGDSWVTLSRNELSNRHISSIACSRYDLETAWLTYGAYGSANVWKTTDLGKTWKSVWGNMPDVAVNGIALYPDDENIIFIATDVGVFATFNGGTTWMPYGTGLPRTVVTGIKLNQEFGYLRCVTHGRGAWEVSLVTSAPSDPLIISPAGAEVFTGTLYTTISWLGFTPPVKLEYSVDDGLDWKPLATNVQGTAYRWKVPNWPTVIGRVRVTSESVPTETQVSRTFTIQVLTKGGTIGRVSVPWVPYGLAWDGKDGLWSTSFYTPRLYKLDYNTLAITKAVELPPGSGDSLFTDLTFDRATQTIYLNKLNSSDGSGSVVIAVDTNGTLVNSFPSAAQRYPLGLEYMNGTLIAGERDGYQRLYIMDMNGTKLDEVDNACKVRYGPRCLASDDNGNLFQTCTFFPNDGAALTDCYAIKFNTSNLSRETDRLTLQTPQGMINARGIEYDRRDGSFWVGDFGGNIYKITGMDFVSPPVTSVSEFDAPTNQVAVYPNPTSSSAMFSVSATTHTRHVHVHVVDVLGNVVSTVYDGVQEAGVDLVTSLPASTLPAGTYTVVVGSKGITICSTAFTIIK